METKNSLEQSLTEGSIGKLIAKFAIPSVTAMLVNALYNIVDQIFIGRGIGYLGNAAANVTLLITLITLAFSLMLGDGSAAYFSLSLGEGEKEKAEKGVGVMLISITFLSILIMIFVLFHLEWILTLFGGTSVIMPLAKEYAVIIVWGLPFIMISTSFNSIIRADGSPRYAMISMILGALINGCLDPILIFTFDLGIRGAAIATFVGQTVTFLISIAYLKKLKCIKLKKDMFSFCPRTAIKICAFGISSFIDQVAFTFVMALNNNLFIIYGAQTVYGSEIPLTAYGIAMKIQEILFTILLGIAIGMQPIVGYNFGAKNYQRVKKTYFYAVSIATVVSCLAVIVFQFFPESILHLFGSSDQIYYLEFGKKFFQTYFLFYIFFGFQTVTGVFFQAIGKPKQATVISLCYQLLFKIVTVLVLSNYMGLNGILWSGPVSDFLIFFLCGLLILGELGKINKMDKMYLKKT